MARWFPPCSPTANSRPVTADLTGVWLAGPRSIPCGRCRRNTPGANAHGACGVTRAAPCRPNPWCGFEPAHAPWSAGRRRSFDDEFAGDRARIAVERRHPDRLEHFHDAHAHRRPGELLIQVRDTANTPPRLDGDLHAARAPRGALLRTCAGLFYGRLELLRGERLVEGARFARDGS